MSGAPAPPEYEPSRLERFRAVLGRRAPRIEVRTFAGPQAWVGQMDRPLRLAHLTDQHVGMLTPMRAQMAAVQQALAAKPDIVVITGDFVCYSDRWFTDLTEVIGAIDVPVFGVLGNHDYWCDAAGVVQTLERAGMEVLRNHNTVIDLDGQRLQIVGLDDAYTGHADREAAVKGMVRGVPTIGLSHIAEEADALWAHGVSLVLSGHTHAGQITVAGVHEVSLGRVMGHRYLHGLYGSRADPSPSGAVYVGAGVGTSRMPIRLGERGRREVAIFELGVAPGVFEEHHGEQQPLTGRAPTEARKANRKARVQRRNAKLNGDPKR